MSTKQLAWHYTIAQLLPAIFESKVLRPATDGVPSGERPILWFSTHPLWEQTANKGWTDTATGQRRGLTFAETVELGGGGLRFGYPTDRLIPWRTLRAGIVGASALAHAGRKHGADPTRWYGAHEPISILDCTLEGLVGLDWVPLE